MVRASPQHPVAQLWAHGEAALPLGVGGRHPDAPVAVVRYVHFPIVAPAAVALPAQHAGPAVEALGGVGQVGLRQTFLDLTLVV